MKQINNLFEVAIGDYILYRVEGNNVNRVYKILEITFAGISNREFIYSSDGHHSNAFIADRTIKNGMWFLLDEKEVNYYLKLVIFKN